MYTVKKLTFWDRIMMAATFAEADEAATARDILNSSRPKRLAHRVEEQADNRPALRL